MVTIMYFCCTLQHFLTFFFFFNDTATTEIYTLSLHDALPICLRCPSARPSSMRSHHPAMLHSDSRSEEHTSELQSLAYLVCRLLLEKKKKNRLNSLIWVPSEKKYTLCTISQLTRMTE